MKKSLVSIIVAISLILSINIAKSQVGDVCPLECDEKLINWNEEFDAASYHNPYMNIFLNPDNNGCCVKECIDYLWQNFECEDENVYALHLRKIYTQAHPYAWQIDPQYYCDGPARSIYLNHLRGLLAFMIWNDTNPLIATAWDFSTHPPTPPWKDNNNPEEFVIRVYQPYCWELEYEEHDCEDLNCVVNQSKQMVLEPCAEIGCPCCYFDYHFEYFDYGSGLVEIKSVVHVTQDLEFECGNESCCYTCAGEGKDKWQLKEGTDISKNKLNKCK